MQNDEMLDRLQTIIAELEKMAVQEFGEMYRTTGKESTWHEDRGRILMEGTGHIDDVARRLEALTPEAE